MKKRLTGLVAACCLAAAMALPANAQEYTFKAPSAGDFGTPTSDDTSMLDATADNCITLFTCVENQPAYRWCVRAVAG